MRIGAFEVTDLTTREQLVNQLEERQAEIERLGTQIDDQQDDVGRLEARIEDQNQEISDLSLAPEQMDRLAEAADLMAELGKIHNTPNAKADWAAGR